MKNFVNDGDTLELIAPTGGVVSGTCYLIGTLVVCAKVSVAQTLTFAALVEGVISYAKPASQAWTQGAAIYWDDTAKNFTTTSAGNTKAGVAVVAVGSGAGETTGIVRLNGVGA